MEPTCSANLRTLQGSEVWAPFPVLMVAMFTDVVVVGEASEAKLVSTTASTTAASHMIAATCLLNAMIAAWAAHCAITLEELQQGHLF